MRSATGETAGQAELRWRTGPAVMQAPSRQRRVLRVADDQRARARRRRSGSAGRRGRSRPRAASVKATAPASSRKPISVISRPSRPLVSAAIGSTLTGLASTARRCRNSSCLRGVDRRPGVGAGDDGGDAAGRGGGAGGAEALLVALAGLADLDADVDDAGGEAPAAAVERRGAAPSKTSAIAPAVDDEAARRRRGRPRGRPGGRWSGSACRPPRPGSFRARRLRREQVHRRHAHGDAHLDLLLDHADVDVVGEQCRRSRRRGSSGRGA